MLTWPWDLRKDWRLVLNTRQNGRGDSNRGPGDLGWSQPGQRSQELPRTPHGNGKREELSGL